MKISLDMLLTKSPLPNVMHRHNRRTLQVLAYHGVDDAKHFDLQMAYLKTSMHPVSVDDVLESISFQLELPQHAVLVTFDDGARSIYDIGLPILQKYDIPAVVFVIADLIGTNHPFWWDEVEQLIDGGGWCGENMELAASELVRQLKKIDDNQRLATIAELQRTAISSAEPVSQLRSEELQIMEQVGVTIGNHTLTHPCLNQCTDKKIRHELTIAHDKLTSTLGHPPVAFAYPNGDWDERAERVLVELGYQAGFLFDHRLSSMPPKHPLRISRVRVDSTTSMERFKLIVSGVHPAIHHAIGRK
ncbi:MAG: polysaccharide deacetylase family protein [Caldilineaceae bacterium]